MAERFIKAIISNLLPTKPQPEKTVSEEKVKYNVKYLLSSNWNPEKHPERYVDSFNIPDEEAADKYLEYLKSQEINVEGIVYEETINGSVVYRRRGAICTQINWSEPGRVPKDYSGEGYPNKFVSFLGPEDRQANRANILADKLGVEVEIKEDAWAQSIPAMGMNFTEVIIKI